MLHQFKNEQSEGGSSSRQPIESKFDINEHLARLFKLKAEAREKRLEADKAFIKANEKMETLRITNDFPELQPEGKQWSCDIRKAQLIFNSANNDEKVLQEEINSVASIISALNAIPKQESKIEEVYRDTNKKT